MRPAVKHDSSLTWDLLVARPLSTCISDENKKLLIWKTKHNPWVSLSLCEAFISSLYSVLFAPLICQLSLLLFVCLIFLFSFLLFAPPLWIGWCESKASAILQRLLAASVCQRPWNVVRVTLTQSRAACRDQDLEKLSCSGETQQDRSRMSWSQGGAAALSGVLALTGHNTNVWSKRFST